MLKRVRQIGFADRLWIRTLGIRFPYPAQAKFKRKVPSDPSPQADWSPEARSFWACLSRFLRKAGNENKIQAMSIPDNLVGDALRSGSYRIAEYGHSHPEKGGVAADRDSK